MSFGKVLEEIKKIEPFLTENVDEGPRETLAGRRGRKNQAIESYKRLKQEYSNYMRQTSAFIVVIGDKNKEFNDIAVKNHKCFTSDPDAFYEDIVSRIPPALYLGGEGMSNIFHIIGRHLEDKMLEFENVRDYPQLIFRQEYARAIKSRTDFLNLVREALSAQIGGEIVGVQAVSSLTDTAIKKRHNAKVTSILLPTSDAKFGLTIARDLERISTRVFVVVAGETDVQVSEDFDSFLVKEPSDTDVKKTLKAISNKLNINK